MTVFHVGACQERLGDVEDLFARAVACGGKEGVGGIVELALDRQIRVPDDLATRFRLGLVDELDEEILCVEHGLARCVHQDAAGELDIRVTPKRTFARVERFRRWWYPVHLDASFGKRHHELPIGDFRGRQWLNGSPQRATTTRAYGNELRALVQLECRFVL